jgi:hypothetical protein
MMTVATLKQQHCNVFDHLTDACDTANWDRYSKRCGSHWVESLSHYTLNGYFE